MALATRLNMMGSKDSAERKLVWRQSRCVGLTRNDRRTRKWFGANITLSLVIYQVPKGAGRKFSAVDFPMKGASFLRNEHRASTRLFQPAAPLQQASFNRLPALQPTLAAPLPLSMRVSICVCSKLEAMTQVSLLPPPCEEFTTSEPLRRATRVKPPGKTQISLPYRI